MPNDPDKKLKESEERYRALFTSSMIGIVVSRERKIVEANDHFLDLIGYTRDDFKAGAVDWPMISPPHYAELDEIKYEEVFQKGFTTPFEKEYFHKKRHLVPVLVGTALINTEPFMVVSFALDITEKKAEERRKDEFLGAVSHELKTPLAVQKMYLHLLSEEIQKAGMEDLVMYAREIDRQIDRLTFLVRQLLDLARIDAKQLPIQKKELSLNECVKRIVDEQHLITMRDIVFNKSSAAPVVIGDEDRLGQIFINLLTNAIKYSPKDKQIIVTVETDKKSASVSIEDFGIGISPDEQPKIFDRFFRTSAAEQSNAGMGIGLYISQSLMQEHGGKITVKSEKGKGSTFICTFPLK